MWATEIASNETLYFLGVISAVCRKQILSGLETSVQFKVLSH